MRILWDDHKRLANRTKHGLEFADLSEEWFETAVTLAARDGREKAVGWLGGLAIAVIIEPLGTEAVAVVSMRRARRDERELLDDP
jgi:uncharacterized DUF497 family protein